MVPAGVAALSGQTSGGASGQTHHRPSLPAVARIAALQAQRERLKREVQDLTTVYVPRPTPQATPGSPHWCDPNELRQSWVSGWDFEFQGKW